MEQREEWRPVRGYEGVYEVSDRGRVKRIASGRGSVPGRILQQIKNGRDGGYRALQLYRGSCRGKTAMVHRLVAEAFIGPIPPGYQVNHKDGNKLNNVPANLEIVTPAENVAHASATGLLATGERRSDTKLKDADVIRIRYELFGQYTQVEIAEMFGVTRKCISHLLYGRTYKHCVRDQERVDRLLQQGCDNRRWMRQCSRCKCVLRKDGGCTSCERRAAKLNNE